MLCLGEGRLLVLPQAVPTHRGSASQCDYQAVPDSSSAGMPLIRQLRVDWVVLLVAVLAVMMLRKGAAAGGAAQ
jgi:hypothetical protein